MDRMLLESFPYRVIEGMTIAARAIGAREAIFYIRAEYPLAVKRIREAIARCEQARADWRRHAGQRPAREVSRHGRCRCVHLRRRDGADQLDRRPSRHTRRCGRPIRSKRGLWERPTLINNVETLACLPWIFRHGGR